MHSNFEKFKMHEKIEKENIRFYIFTRYKLGISAASISKELDMVWGLAAPSDTMVRNWIRNFKAGVETFKDQPRPGRSITRTNSDNISLVKAVIDVNPYASYDEIQEETLLCHGTINTIIHDHLQLRKITSRWVPHLLNDEAKQKRVNICQENLEKLESGEWRLCDILTGDECWIYLRPIKKKQSNKAWVEKGENPKIVVKRDRFEAKYMFTFFFKSDGPMHVSYLERGRTVDHATYIESTLKPLVESIKMVRPKCGTKNLKLHHDNARPHVEGTVVDFIIEQDMTIMGHPPYSPDLAPCDFWLNSYIKDRLVEQPNVEALHASITELISSIPKNEYQKTFNKWVERMRLCIKYEGDYFEHLIK